MSVRNRLLLMSFTWLGSLGFLPGAVLHYNNFNFALDGTELLLVDNAGNPVVDGFIALYHFGADPEERPEDVVSLRNNGDDGLLDVVPISNVNSPGGIGILVTPLTGFNQNGELVGLPLYLVMGNGPSVSESSQLALLRSELSFGVGDASEVQQVFFEGTASDVEIGSVSTRPIVSIPAGVAWEAKTMVLAVVPEPHVAALLIPVLILTGFRRRRASSILVGNRGKGRSSREKPVIRSVLKRPGSRHRAGERPTIKRDSLFP